MPLMSWQLWLAKDVVVETRLPWQSATINLSPGRVAQSMFSVAEFVRAGFPLMERTQALVEIGTPAQVPKLRENLLAGLKETHVLSHLVIRPSKSG